MRQEGLEAILEAKSTILEAKKEKLIFHVDFWEGSVECAWPFGYAKSTASTAGAFASSHAEASLAGCGGFFGAPRMPPTPRSRTFYDFF